MIIGRNHFLPDPFNVSPEVTFGMYQPNITSFQDNEGSKTYSKRIDL